MNFQDQIRQLVIDHPEYRHTSDLPTSTRYGLVVSYLKENNWCDVGEVTVPDDFTRALVALDNGDDQQGVLHIRDAVIASFRQVLDKAWYDAMEWWEEKSTEYQRTGEVHFYIGEEEYDYS